MKEMNWKDRIQDLELIVDRLRRDVRMLKCTDHEWGGDGWFVGKRGIATCKICGKEEAMTREEFRSKKIERIEKQLAKLREEK